jgi:hypothetical protein
LKSPLSNWHRSSLQKDKNIDLQKALNLISPHFGDEKSWGKIDTDVMDNFLNWLYNNDLEQKRLEASELIVSNLTAD